MASQKRKLQANDDISDFTDACTSSKNCHLSKSTSSAMQGNDSDCDSDESTGRACTTSSRQWYSQAFKKEWLEDPLMKDWLEPDNNDKYIVRCKVCDDKLSNTNKAKLLAHKATKKHIRNFESRRTTPSIANFLAKKGPSLKENVTKAELSLVSFLAEHNTPFAQADHLVGLCKKMFPDSAIAKAMSLKRTKASYVMRGVADQERSDINSILETTKFSIIIDESTDISVSQILAVIVRYYDNVQCCVKDALLDTVEVEDGTAQGLYTSVKTLFAQRNIPINNVIGFASDNCSTMMGVNSGFQKLLQQDVPSVFILGCVCHSLALCASYASRFLPSWLEVLVKNICSYFSHSCKRQQTFKLIQDVVQLPTHRVMKLSQTRWLSRGQVLARIIEQWDALILFFQSEAPLDKIDGASKIHEQMITTGTKHMLLFVKYVVAKIDQMNVEFQSEHLRVHVIHSRISDHYRDLLAMFVRNDVLQNKALADLDPSDQSCYMPLSDIELGGRCESLLAKEPLGSNETRFRTDCQTYLKELCKQIKKRFCFQETSVLARLNVLDVNVALLPERRPRSVTPLAVSFPSIVAEDELDILQDQWKLLLNSKQSTLSICKLNPEQFWWKLGELKDGNDEPMFGVLSRLMCSLMSLPVSSACVERIFSQVNMIKNSRTNRLHAESLASRLLARQAVRRCGTDCQTWSPSPTLVEDVSEGRCHQRYMNRVKECADKNVIHVVDNVSDDTGDNPYDPFVERDQFTY